MNRFDEKFKALKADNKKALIPFIMAGDPDMTVTRKHLDALVAGGADVIEIGMPFSDPVADGPTIQAAGLRALKNDISLDQIMECVSDFRENNQTTPILLMGYYNPVYQYGVQNFCSASVKAGVDGVILVDLPPEEEGEFTPHAKNAGLDLIKLITPTTDEERLKTILKNAGGFVYYVSVAGITGDKSAQYDQVERAVDMIRTQTDLPVAVGFGIKTRNDVASVHKFADAAVVGSALIKYLEDHGQNPDHAKAFLSDLSGL